jgi:hypothetical protein
MRLPLGLRLLVAPLLSLLGVEALLTLKPLLDTSGWGPQREGQQRTSSSCQWGHEASFDSWFVV